MPYLVLSVLVWTAVFIFAGRELDRLWKAGLIGVAITAMFDHFGTTSNLYIYPEGLFYIGRLPIFHLFQTYALSILYLHWLPRKWGKRLVYTSYASALLLTVEVLMNKVGAIIYLKWNIWYSYPLLVAGLMLTAFLADLLVYRRYARDPA